MSQPLSPPKIVLLAVHLAAHAEVDSLALLTARHPTILRKHLILRIILTYLPETVPSVDYVDLIHDLFTGGLAERDDTRCINPSPIQSISDDEAFKKARKLRLLRLAFSDHLSDPEEDPVTLFLLRRAHRVDEEAGMLTQLPALLTPFLQQVPDMRTWMLSNLVPLLRRNYEYYPHNSIPYTLAEFQKLPDSTAVSALLSHTGAGGDLSFIGRDLRGLVGPWLHNDVRWVSGAKASPSLREGATHGLVEDQLVCPGWERVLEWLLDQASRSWRVAVAAVEQWNGPEDVDLGDFDSWLSEERQRYLDQRYARAILGCAYLIPDATTEALEGAHRTVVKAMDLLGEDSFPSLSEAAESLPSAPGLGADLLSSPKNTTHMRDDLLSELNPLTALSEGTVHLLHVLILSAFLLTRQGVPCSVKQMGDLAFIQDEKEQKIEVAKLIHAIASKAPRNDDNYWQQARVEILWLRDWGSAQGTKTPCLGVFGQVKTDFIEAEFLKVLLANSRYALAKSLYEDGLAPLPKQVLQDTIVAAALNAYDNASNPNRTRGGLKKCDDIINALPQTITKSLPAKQRIEALLKATHALSEYRLVLKQGEPFSPVVLRVHSDPISIVAKVLAQNPKSYTAMQDFLEVGTNMVKAGLTSQHRSLGASEPLNPSEKEAEAERIDLASAHKRIIAMCIESALAEDDFETAYSYVVNRLTDPRSSPSLSSGHFQSLKTTRPKKHDDDSWRAAFFAGQYIRTPRTTRPTHLGTASGNPEVRHLEQRIDCLSVALRAAPAAQLQEILKTFRRCEEQLDSALREEAAMEAADERQGSEAHMRQMPGGFAPSPSAPVSAKRESAKGVNLVGAAARPNTSTRTAKTGQTEEAPMSLFDLSRATARAASRNFAALSTLQASSGSGVGGGSANKTRAAAAGNGGAGAPLRSGTASAASTRSSRFDDDDGENTGEAWGDWGDDGESEDRQQRVRKRDQLREAAMGTLTSGVGWLIGAPAPTPGQAPQQGEEEEQEERPSWREERESRRNDEDHGWGDDWN